MPARADGDRDLVPFARGVFGGLLEGGSEQCFQVLGRERAAQRVRDLPRGEPRGRNGVVGEVLAELVRVELSQVLDERVGEVGG